MVATFLLPDASGNTVSWMVLPQLREPWENIATYSWGSATLAWLYRQLCEACRRGEKTSNIGGCTYLLQLWIWERIPTGRVHREKVPVSAFLPPFIPFVHFLNITSLCHVSNLYFIGVSFKKWPFADCRPPVCYLWTKIKSVRGHPQRRYVQYSNDLDVLTFNQVHYWL
jgi:hypothetical protein